MLGKVLALTTLISFVLLSAILQVTSPATSHPVVILVVFGLIYVLALGVLTFLLLTINRTIKSFSPEHRRVSVHLKAEHAYYYASVLALTPVLLLGVKSVGHLGIYEVALIVIFEIVACFYVARRK
jgi:hypothetical protein